MPLNTQDNRILCRKDALETHPPAAAPNQESPATPTTGSSIQDSPRTVLDPAWEPNPKNEIIPNPHETRMDRIFAISKSQSIRQAPTKMPEEPKNGTQSETAYCHTPPLSSETDSTDDMVVEYGDVYAENIYLCMRKYRSSSSVKARGRLFDTVLRSDRGQHSRTCSGKITQFPSGLIN
jgi:hypothetical protein